MVSPNSICIDAEVTGARPKGQSSRWRGRWTLMSQRLAIGLPEPSPAEVRERRFAPLARAQGASASSSSEAPDLEIRTRRSPGKTAPRSP